MSNSVTIQRTIFQNISADGTEGSVSFGIRVYDDHDNQYDNMEYSSKEDLMAATPQELIELASGISDQASAMIEFAKEVGAPIFVDGENVNETPEPKF